MAQTSTVEIVRWSSEGEFDLSVLAHLITEFGRPTSVDEMNQRLARLATLPASFPSALLLARDTQSGEVVGLLHASIPFMVIMDATAEIYGLVVDSRYRGRRIGQQLVEAAEAWAREQGVVAMRLYTNMLRTDAHRFYEHLGYAQVKASYTYAKSL